ncbi:HlyU family transcriptional regulator [Halomonas urumqiensis]|uniref:Transcriptional activator HlyU n=1 Tax=Halomonas urumqiensis TaxID=1684789 RepID=A0A2N7UGK1_9GAMM|nr:HlyU family transcriptional regulator [Halomonas urumqiensis]PMR79598.1 hypothetical protein C1H70_11485 [Halomonas urumqiensis]PTB01048.1 hypothetical protein C6V82_17195 [Halomonas urumqiensis]GHE22877.1 hypothetical protein GCM10017767_33980 [Halomonas urumqiensis]
MFKKLLSGLLGGGNDQPRNGGHARSAEPVEYNGYEIVSEPADQGGQFRVSGVIRKSTVDGETLEHRFERSDMVTGREACDELMVTKARRFVDEVGDDMFKPR